MYKLYLWLGPGRDVYIQLRVPDDHYWQRDWCLTDSLASASELTIEWIQESLGLIYEITNPEKLEIIQVREHTK